MTGLGVATRVLFWDCQCGHLLSGHPEKEISEKGKKLRCFQTLLCIPPLSPWGRGAFKEIPFRRNGAVRSAQEDAKARWGLLVLSTGHGLFWVDFQTGKALYGLQGCREVGYDPELRVSAL